MPFSPGEQVNLRFVGDPDTSVLRFDGAEYTAADGGLVQRRNNGLIAILTLPLDPGSYPYEFETAGTVTATGVLRVRGRGGQPVQRLAPMMAVMAAPMMMLSGGGSALLPSALLLPSASVLPSAGSTAARAPVPILEAT